MTSSFAAGSLIASATTTAAGIYLLARVYPILTPDVRLLICIIGVVTLTMAALIAAAQDDIRRVLAPWFSPPAIEAWAPAIAEESERALDDHVNDGRIDVVILHAAGHGLLRVGCLDERGQ